MGCCCCHFFPDPPRIVAFVVVAVTKTLFFLLLRLLYISSLKGRSIKFIPYERLFWVLAAVCSYLSNYLDIGLHDQKYLVQGGLRELVLQ